MSPPYAGRWRAPRRLAPPIPTDLPAWTPRKDHPDVLRIEDHPEPPARHEDDDRVTAARRYLEEHYLSPAAERLLRDVLNAYDALHDAHDPITREAHRRPGARTAHLRKPVPEPREEDEPPGVWSGLG